MNRRLNEIIEIIKKDSVFFLGISIGIFLFILFFEPFSTEVFDYDNRLLFLAGLGIIIYLFLTGIRLVVTLFIKAGNNDTKTDLQSYIEGFLLWALSSVAFAFYLRYVGSIEITFHIMLKAICICLVPAVILRFNEKFGELRTRNAQLQKEKNSLKERIEKFEADSLNKSFEFISENSKENLKILLSDVVYITSADNYVEIVYKEGTETKKKLIRNTLKNISHQLKEFSNFIRCHRTCIVNINYVEELKKQYNNYKLSLKNIAEKIPVSRQYLLKVREYV